MALKGKSALYYKVAKILAAYLFKLPKLSRIIELALEDD